MGIPARRNRRRDFPPADLHRKSRLAMAVAARTGRRMGRYVVVQPPPCIAGQKLHRPPAGTGMGMHSRSGRLFYLRDLHGAGMACRSAVPGPAADQRRTFHLGNGDSQQIYVLRFVLPIAGCLRHHPRIVDQCQPGRQPDSVRRGGPRRARRFGIRTPAAAWSATRAVRCWHGATPPY